MVDVNFIIYAAADLLTLPYAMPALDKILLWF